MKIVDISKNKNLAIVNYNGKDTLFAPITRMCFINGKLHIEVKLPDWCCNGSYKLINVSDNFELKVKE